MARSGRPIADGGCAFTVTDAKHTRAVPPETLAVADRILEDVECQACLASKPKDER